MTFESSLIAISEDQSPDAVNKALQEIAQLDSEGKISHEKWEEFAICLERRFLHDTNFSFLWRVLLGAAGIFLPLGCELTDHRAVMLRFIIDEAKAALEVSSMPVELDFSGQLLVNALILGVSHNFIGALEVLVMMATGFEELGPITLVLAVNAVQKLPA